MTTNLSGSEIQPKGSISPFDRPYAYSQPTDGEESQIFSIITDGQARGRILSPEKIPASRITNVRSRSREINNPRASLDAPGASNPPPNKIPVAAVQPPPDNFFLSNQPIQKPQQSLLPSTADIMAMQTQQFFQPATASVVRIQNDPKSG